MVSRDILEAAGFAKCESPYLEHEQWARTDLSIEIAVVYEGHGLIEEDFGFPERVEMLVNPHVFVDGEGDLATFFEVFEEAIRRDQKSRAQIVFSDTDPLNQ